MRVRTMALGGAAALAVGAVAASPAAGSCGGPKRARATHHSHVARPPLIIGDSTMIFATPMLGGLGIEADAQGCRQFGQGVAMLAARRHARTLPPVAILALGANGAIGAGRIASALRVTGAHRVLGLVTPRNSATTRSQMRLAARRHRDRVLLIDWARFSAAHGRWFAGDGLHVNGAGAAAFAKLVRRSLAFAFPPVRLLHLPARARATKRCGVVRRFGHPLRVYVVRGRARVVCVRARALVRGPPLRPIRNWSTYDWRRVHRGPWAWVYARRDRHAVVAAVAGRG